MASRPLGSLVRGSMRARSCFSSPGIALEEAMGSAASGEADRLRSVRNALAAAGTSAFAGSRFLHSRAAAQKTKMVRPRDGYSLPGMAVQGSLGSPVGRGVRWFHFHHMRGVVVEHADGATATLSVVFFSVVAGILHLIEDTDELDKACKEDTPTKIRADQLGEELKRERASYNNKAMLDEKAVVQEFMEEDEAMRASFEEWMKAYGKTYKDEVEKARRFKIFKAVVRFTDAFNEHAFKSGWSVRFGLNQFSDRSKEEVVRLCGVPGWRGGGYYTMVLYYLAQQEIWHQVDKNKEYED